MKILYKALFIIKLFEYYEYTNSISYTLYIYDVIHKIYNHYYYENFMESLEFTTFS